MATTSSTSKTLIALYGTALAWRKAQDPKALAQAEAAAGMEFPAASLRAAVDTPGYETLEIAGRRLIAWRQTLSDADAELLVSLDAGAIAAGAPVPLMAPNSEVLDGLRQDVMPAYRLDPDSNTVTAIPYDLADWGRDHNLAHFALHGDLQASVFDRPFKAVSVYDGAEALTRGPGSLPSPIGLRAEYRIVVLDGMLQHPPAFPPRELPTIKVDKPEADPSTDTPDMEMF